MKRLSLTPVATQKNPPRSFQQAPTEPQDTPLSGQALAHWQTLWDALPHEIAQKIVWHRATPPGPNRQRALAQRIELFHTLMVDRKLYRAALPLFGLVRWADEFAKYWPEPPAPNALATPKPDIEVLVGNPLASRPGGTIELTLDLPEEPDGAGRLNLLLGRLNTYAHLPFLKPLLKRLFGIWLDRRSDATAHAMRLPLNDLPQRLLHTDALLTPPCVYEAIRVDYSCLPLRDVGSAPVQLLMRHFAHFDDALKLSVALHLLLLLEDDELQVTPPTWAALQQHGVDQDATFQQALHWKSGLLDPAPQQANIPLATDALPALKRLRPLSGLACMTLLSRFFAFPGLRALESDDTWIELIRQAMAEIHHRPPQTWTDTLRADYLVALLPEDLGVAAFNRLSPAQRLLFIRKPYCGLYFRARIYVAYLRALANANDVDPQERLATLEHFIQGVRSYGAHDENALPQLTAWRQRLAKASAPRQPHPHTAPV